MHFWHLACSSFSWQLAKAFQETWRSGGKCLTQLGDSVKLLLGRLGSTLRVLGVSWEFLGSDHQDFWTSWETLGRVLAQELGKLGCMVSRTNAALRTNDFDIALHLCTSASQRAGNDVDLRVIMDLTLVPI